MHAFQVCGPSGSGKTTLITALIHKFIEDGLQVASIKDIHNKNFRIDQPGKDSDLHRKAGADPVVIRGLKETTFLYSKHMSLMNIASQISAEWLLVEGFHDFPLPRIVCGIDNREIDKYIDERTIALSGRTGRIESYPDIPFYDVRNKESLKKLFNEIITRIPPLLPHLDCKACGMTCAELTAAILRNEKQYTDCTAISSKIMLKIGDQSLSLNPFVQRILKNTVLGIVKELRGAKNDQTVELIIQQ